LISIFCKRVICRNLECITVKAHDKYI